MINIFLSCSSKDHDFIKGVIDDLTVLPDKYRLIYFLQPYNVDTPMEYILERLSDTDLFIVFISDSSLESIYVRSELNEAIRLYQLGYIKEICSIIIDPNIQKDKEYRIPQCILNNNVFCSESQSLAAEFAKNFILKY